MQSFKHFLQEASWSPNFAPWHITDPDKLKALIKNMDWQNEASNYRVVKNGTIKVAKNGIHFRWGGATAIKAGLSAETLPFKFAAAGDNFTMHLFNATDIWGAPDASGYFTIKANELQSLQHLEGVYSDLALYCPKLERFDCKVQTDYVFINDIAKFDAKDFANSFSSKIGKLSVNFGVVAVKSLHKTPLLSLLRNKDFNRIDFLGISITRDPILIEMRQVFDIINEYRKDILGCQDALIEAGLKEYAKL